MTSRDRGEVVRGWIPGLLGELVRWHGLYYVQSLGWPARFEAIVAQEAGELAAAADDGDVQAWSVWRGAQFLAGLAIDGRHGEGSQAAGADVSGPDRTARGARLRFFIAADAARGLGLGNRLMQDALSWCDARGYFQVWLTTVRGRDAAAHLYRKFGFVLRDEHIDASWGTPMHEQRWERQASATPLSAVATARHNPGASATSASMTPTTSPNMTSSPTP